MREECSAYLNGMRRPWGAHRRPAADGAAGCRGPPLGREDRAGRGSGAAADGVPGAAADGGRGKEEVEAGAEWRRKRRSCG
jgi:hypothetical protein